MPANFTHIVAHVFVWRPTPPNLRNVLRTCLSGGRCQPIRARSTRDLRQTRPKICWHVGGHLIDGVSFLTVALLARDQCCCDTAHKRSRPHANAGIRPNLLQDTLKPPPPRRPKPPTTLKPRWRSLLPASFITKSKATSMTSALISQSNSSPRQFVLRSTRTTTLAQPQAHLP